MAQNKVKREVRRSLKNAKTSGEVHADIWRNYTTPPPLSSFHTSYQDLFNQRYKTNPFSSDQELEYNFFCTTNGKLNNLNTASLKNFLMFIYGIAVDIDTEPWWVTLSFGQILSGEETLISGLDYVQDGSYLVWPEIASGEVVAAVSSLTIRRGDTSAIVTLSSSDLLVTNNGFIEIDNNSNTRSLLGYVSGNRPGLSLQRGDTITEMIVELSEVSFGWNRNDGTRVRFYWDDFKQSWSSLRGSNVLSLGKIDVDELVITGFTTRKEANDFLEYDSGVNFYSFRVGSTFSEEDSTGLLAYVVEDDVIGTSFDFSSVVPNPQLIIGKTSGRVELSSATQTTHTGYKLWYSAEKGTQESDGALCSIRAFEDKTVYLSPIPLPFETALLRVGESAYLSVNYYEQESEVILPTGFNQCAVALNTGRVFLSEEILNRSEPTSGFFDKNYYNSVLYYDGVQLGARDQHSLRPQPLLDEDSEFTKVESSNRLFIPRAELTFAEGLSGWLQVPDLTGRTAGWFDSNPITDISNVSGNIYGFPENCEMILFNQTTLIRDIIVTNNRRDIPTDARKIPKGRAYIAMSPLNGTETLPELFLSKQDRTDLEGQDLYFKLCGVSPCIQYQSIYYSTRTGPVTFDRTQRVYLGDGSLSTTLTFNPATYSVVDIVTALQSEIDSLGWDVEVSYFRDLISFRVNSADFLELVPRDSESLDFFEKLGIPPGIIIENADFILSSSEGFIFQTDISPDNITASSSICDFIAVKKIEDQKLQDKTIGSPINFLPTQIREDLPGYDSWSFLKRKNNDFVENLFNYDSVLYDSSNKKYYWLQNNTFYNTIATASNVQYLGAQNIVPESLISAVNSGYLELAEPGSDFVYQSQEVDYKLRDNGVTGTVEFFTNIGGLITSGTLGKAVGASFTDTEASFVGVASGMVLELTVENKIAFFVIGSISGSTLTLEEAPDVGANFQSWRIFDTKPLSSNDLTIVADAQYVTFNHLQSEPFKVRKLKSVGLTPSSLVDQDDDRLALEIKDQLSSSRQFYLRRNISGENIALYSLGLFGLGTVGSTTTYQIPYPLGDHFTEESFYFWVSESIFEPGISANLVVAFSSSIASNTIEYLATGEVRLADNLISEHQDLPLFYVQTFRDPSNLGLLEAEIDPFDGEINLSEEFILAYGGQDIIYSVQELITEQRLDCTINPINGNVTLNSPMFLGESLEVEYNPADSSGEKLLDDSGNEILITEILPVYIKGELSTYLGNKKFQFNTLNRTIIEDIPIDIYEGPNLLNYTGILEATAVPEANQISFIKAVENPDNVTISYAVYEAAGGEIAYTISTIPAYRMPFFIERSRSTFSLEGDRTSELESGKILKIGTQTIYITDSSHNVSTDTTTVSFYPPTTNELGSRSPGNDFVYLISDRPLRIPPVEVDSSPGPVGPSTPVLNDEDGFWVTVSTDFMSSPKGSTMIFTKGDLTEIAYSGIILEINNKPYTVAASIYDDVNLTTQVTLTTGLYEEINSSAQVRASFRPILLTGTTSFSVGNAILASEESILFIKNRADGDINTKLTPNVDYTLDVENGNINLTGDYSKGILPNESLIFIYKEKKTLSPIIYKNILIKPRLRASFQSLLTPNGDNGYLNNSIFGKFYFNEPDSFYLKIETLDSAVLIEQNRITSEIKEASNTGTEISFALSENSDKGVITPKNLLTQAYNRDRVARYLLKQFSTVCTSIDQILEIRSGTTVGDDSNKFRFDYEDTSEVPVVNGEDIYTGVFYPNNLFFRYFESVRAAFNLHEISLRDNSPLVEAVTATANSLNELVSGKSLSTTELRDISKNLQLLFKRNDIDDILLVGSTALPSINGARSQRKGLYESIYLSPASRIYPQQGTFFGQFYPGAEADEDTNDNGFYTFGRFSGSTFNRTAGDAIGEIQNPVSGQITNISNISLGQRFAAGLVLGLFQPIPTLIAELYAPTLIEQSRLGIVLTVVNPEVLNVDTATSLPLPYSFITEGGDVLDLNTGVPDLSRSPWLVGSSHQVYLITSEGKIPLTKKGSPNILTGEDTYLPVYVEAIYSGCFITLRTSEGPVTSLNDLNLDALVVGATLTLERVSDNSVALSDPLTQADLIRISSGNSEYRVGVDVGVNLRNGVLFDKSLPSSEDSFFLPIKELTGQNTPEPLSFYEGTYFRGNSATEPTKIPALYGQALNDSGDRSLPYKWEPESELQILREIFASGKSLISADALSDTNAIYPDEISVTNGTLLEVSSGVPSHALLTTQSPYPVTDGGSYVEGSGIGDAAPYDLILVEDNAVNPDYITGILSIGKVEEFSGVYAIKPPRFITPSRQGDRLRYTLLNAMTIDGSGSPGTVGLTASENLGGGFTRLTRVGISSPVFNEGLVSVVGGLNNIVDSTLNPFPNNNVISINLFDSLTGNTVDSLQITSNTISSSLGTSVLPSTVLFSDSYIQIPILGVVDLGSYGAGPFSFTLDLICNSATDAGSDLAYIGEDRLTFYEGIDLSTCREDSATILGVTNIETRLNVHYVTGPTSEDMDVNNASHTNGGALYSFVLNADNVVGSFSPASVTGAKDELGSIEVPSIRGNINQDLGTYANLVFNLVPSSLENETSQICGGQGTADNSYPYQLNQIEVSSGDLELIEEGDILIIDQAAVTPGNPIATSKAGTFLIKQVIPDRAVDYEATGVFGDGLTPSGFNFQLRYFPIIPGQTVISVASTAGAELRTDDGAGNIGGGTIDYITGEILGVSFLGAPLVNEEIKISYVCQNYPVYYNDIAGTSTELFNTNFPEIIVANSSLNTLQVNTLNPFTLSPTGHGYASSGRLYIINNANNIYSANVDLKKVAVVSAAYTSIDTLLNVFEGLSDFKDSDNITISSSLFYSLAVAGVKISGAAYLEAQAIQKDALPQYNVVGLDQATVALLGFNRITLSNSPQSASEVFSYSEFTGGPPSAGELQFYEKLAVSPLAFQSNISSPVYDRIAGGVRIDQIQNAQWANLHNSLIGVNCLLPGDSLSTYYIARQGIYLEPTFPTVPYNYLQGPLVVDTDNSLNPGQVGFTSGPTATEDVRFKVKRIRRWHQKSSDIISNTNRLKRIYETPKGLVDAIHSSDSLGIFEIEVSETQFGSVDNLNIQPGDLFITPSPTEPYEYTWIGEIVSEPALDSIKVKSLYNNGSIGLNFEIYRKTGLAPYEQSLREACLKVGEEIVIINADPNTSEGGLCSTPNILTTFELVNFLAADVQVGDYVIIDPAGDLSGPTSMLSPPEKGYRPSGDLGVDVRSGYVANTVSELDDNRGVYRITEVTANELTLGGCPFFGGPTYDSNVIFSTLEDSFAVYPTVGISSLPGLSNEGQMMLRPTAFAGTEGSSTNSYSNNAYSVGPFSFKIVRPHSFVSQKTFETIFVYRERILSWIENYNSSLPESLAGDYFTFQLEAQITNLPSATNVGTGVLSNSTITSILGNYTIAPYINSIDGLSILDRRVQIRDTALDQEYSDEVLSVQPYTQMVADVTRPVLQDDIEGIVLTEDRLYDDRYFWIDRRTNLTYGSINRIKQYKDLVRKNKLSKLSRRK